MSSNKPARRKKKAGTPAPDDPSAVLNTKGLFTKDLTTMMYGFGDDQTPYKESVELVEEIMVDYVAQTMEKAIASATSRGGKPTTEDLIFLVRKDPKKFSRVRELLHLQQEIAAARKGFDVDDNAAGAS